MNRNKEILKTVRENLEWIAQADELSGISTIDTFDKQLANRLRTVRGSARDALAYMAEREGVK